MGEVGYGWTAEVGKFWLWRCSIARWEIRNRNRSLRHCAAVRFELRLYMDIYRSLILT
jgi:hypothetical protein